MSIAIFIFLVATVLASPLQVNPSTLDVDVIKGVNKDVYLNITNTNSYTLYDVDIVGNYVISDIINDLQANQTKQIKITINNPNTGSVDYSLVARGFRDVNCTQLGTETKEINITAVGALPRDLEICKNSNIKYINNYGNSIRVVISALSVDNFLNDGDSYIQNYLTVGNYIYRIEPLIDLGTISVVESTQKSHNTLDDFTIFTHLDSVLEATIITLSLNTNFFNLSYNSLGSSFFIIKNTGSVKAESINFFGDWLSFDKSNVVLNPNEEKAINFVVSPVISSSNQTGKDYIKTLLISGSNNNEIRENISIFIKPTDIAGGNLSTPEWWIKRKEFCVAFPSSPDCLTEPFVIFRDKPIYDCPAILANVSPKDVQISMQECNALRGDFSSFTSNVKTDLLDFKNVVLGVVAFNDGVNSTLSENSEIISDFRNTFYFSFGLIFLGIFLGTGFLLLRRQYMIRKRKSRLA